jgi:hypothetical protein
MNDILSAPLQAAAARTEELLTRCGFEDLFKESHFLTQGGWRGRGFKGHVKCTPCEGGFLELGNCWSDMHSEQVSLVT